MEIQHLLSRFTKCIICTLLYLVAQTAHSQDISSFAKIIKPNSSCLQYKVVAPCICPGIPPYVCGFIVKHYLPVAIIEVVKGPGDTIFGGAGSEKTGVINLSTEDGIFRGFEARIWEITDQLRAYAMIGVNCALCGNR